MEIRDFTEKIKNIVGERLGEEYEVRVQEVRKNNGVLLLGLVILSQSRNVSPTIYLDSFYEAYESGVTLSVIVERILSIYETHTPGEDIDMSFFRNFEGVKDRICYKLISAEQNRELLEEIPHFAYLDLAVCFYYAYQGETLGSGSILIYNTHLDMWRCDGEELLRLARENTPRLFPWECCSMEDLLRELAGREDNAPHSADGECAQVPMRILSNRSRVFGAACILYPGLLERLAAGRDCGLYIIPSSVHEVILLEESGAEDVVGLRGIIDEVNKSQLEPEEILSYRLYYFDRHTGTVSIV